MHLLISGWLTAGCTKRDVLSSLLAVSIAGAAAADAPPAHAYTGLDYKQVRLSVGYCTQRPTSTLHPVQCPDGILQPEAEVHFSRMIMHAPSGQ
jgi:hypothetical protein